MVESNVHYPTDINLLFDAMRCSIRTIAQVCEACGDSSWRQWKYNIRQVKKAYRKAQKLKRSTSKDPEKKAQRQQLIEQAHADYLALSTAFLLRIRQTLERLNITAETAHPDLQRWMDYGYHQVDLIRRRVIEGETIPHIDKVFSIFEDYTEWLCKGKAGVPVELGLNVCVMECRDGFMLHHKVMQQCVDKDVAVDMVRETKALFPQLACCSFDKGFHSMENRKQLEQLLDHVVLPKKGRWSKADRARESEPSFVQARRQHSAVESGINALEVHGLDRCLDRGLEHFKRYIALAVAGRNLQKIGAILQTRELKQLQKAEKRARQKAA